MGSLPVSFENLLTHHAVPTLVTTATGEVLWQNAASQDTFSLSVGQSLTQLCPAPESLAQLTHSLSSAMHGIAGAGIPLTLSTSPHAPAQPFLFAAAGITGPDGLIRSTLVTFQNHAAEIAQENALQQSRQRFADFAAATTDWLWEADAAGIFTYISPGVEGILGYAPARLTGHLWLTILFGENEDPLRDRLDALWNTRQPFQGLEIWTRDRAGSRICLRLSATPVFHQGAFAGFRGVGTNITGTKLDREHTYRLATTDHLTGLLNWIRFKEELARGISLSKNHKSQGVLVLIDLDRFKEVNDTHGHEAGDKILMAVSDIFRENVRSTDIVARRGGDEFAILLHSVTLPEAEAKIDTILQKVAQLRVDHHGVPLMVTMSAGLVPYPHANDDPERLIMSADLAMYRAKDLGRNRLYADTADSSTLHTGSIAAQLKGVERLKECLATDDFEMHYQAIVPARPRQRPLFEALLRISDADGKPLPPPLFIEAAEHFGLIQQLDLAVIRKVFRAQYALQQAGGAADVSINLSSRSVGDEDVITELRKIIQTYPVDPNRIIFEVTETMALHDPAQMRDISSIRHFISEMREMGFRFALDDFGTGFTSFKYLKVLPLDVVKIDGEYIKDILTDAEDKLFVKSMVDLCKGLGIATIAEFVENEACMNLLIELGIDYGQGWHFAKPLPNLPELAPRFTHKSMADFGTAPALVARMLDVSTEGTPHPLNGAAPIEVTMQEATLSKAPVKAQPAKTPKAKKPTSPTKSPRP